MEKALEKFMHMNEEEAEKFAKANGFETFCKMKPLEERIPLEDIINFQQEMYKNYKEERRVSEEVLNQRYTF
ncbi:MAG: hypothetical protein LBO09_00495 [Candidatus Peribacteria bacterium]|jgi:hypothetical protein|nr:hypothetical protein [Candidatus Peribacteria bacterium]